MRSSSFNPFVLSPFRANNDGAKIRPEGDVTAEEGTSERGTRPPRVEVSVSHNAALPFSAHIPTCQTEGLFIIVTFMTD